MRLTDNQASSYLAVPELPRIQQTLDGRAVNTKFRGYLVDGKVLFNRLCGLGLFRHLVRMLDQASVNESLSQ